MNLSALGVKEVIPIEDEWYALKVIKPDIYNKIHYVLFRQKAIVQFDLKLKMNVVKINSRYFSKLLLFSRKMKFHNMNNQYTNTNQTRCIATTKKGHQCKFNSVQDSDYCWYHKITTIRDE